MFVIKILKAVNFLTIRRSSEFLFRYQLLKCEIFNF